MPEPIPFRDALETAERELDRLATRLDVSLEGRSQSCMVVLGIARQAFEVYRGLRREAAADALGITGPILLRSLADAAILLRWIQDNPPLRVEMYFAEDDRQLLAVAPELVDGDDELRRAQVACKARAKSWRGPRGRSR